MKSASAVLIPTVLCFGLFLNSARAQGTTLTYQGQLMDAGHSANGAYDMIFYLRDAQNSGNPVGPTNTVPLVAVSNGLFTVLLDSGKAVFTGPQRWPEHGARTTASVSPYMTLSPRQALTPAPYALYAPNAAPAATASSVSASAVSAPQLNTPAAPVAGQVLAYDGAGLAWTNAGAGSGTWLLGGNAGTSPVSNFLGTTDGQALALRANGGINFSTGTTRVSLAGPPALDFGDTPRQMLNLYQAAYGIGVQNLTIYFRTASDFSWFIGGGHTNVQNDPGPGGDEQMRLGGNRALNVRQKVGAQSITLSTHRKLKEKFEPTNPREVPA